MSAPSKVIELVERFNDNLDSYKRGNYNETKLRIEYINPFFEELGWDVQNKQGYAEAYKDVVHEDAIKIAGATKAPDYCFRIGGTRKFFLEAKKPSVYIKEAIHPAYQLRRYAWSAKLHLSILTDFEEFAIYDCRIKPIKNDKPSNARIQYMTFKDYPDRWEEIASIFSREAILKGSFDKYSESNKQKRGTAEVDDAFLSEIESWRSLLAKNFAIRNPRLTNRQLNEIVQKTVDRIIFLRICEDRGIEDYGQLMSLQNGTNIYSRLCKIYIRADDKYNSGLFYFSFEKGRQEPDRLSLDLNLDDKVLKDIFKRLYYPDSPYEFSVLPADILGQVYEQFLGKVIRLTSGHRAIVEEKPEVRKAGGVYYTPTYIVDYIVKNTVGKLLEGKTPKQAAKLKILDPACGSGSFLLGAYQYLLGWYLKQYVDNNPEKHSRGKSPKICQTQKGEWKLTTAEKKRILLNNIYGVDIDTQAVEVTKLSLLLRVLESETEQSLQSQLKLFHERALPDLGNNIKCGNSLIGSDYYVGKQATMFDEEEMYKVNAFDWEKEFEQIIKAGGFDAVIGNPPYGYLFNSEENSYIAKVFKIFSAISDAYIGFVERSQEVLRKNGRFGFIIPSAWLGGPAYKNLRAYFLKFKIETIVLLPFDVFKEAYIDTVLITTCKDIPSGKDYVTTYEYPKKEKISSIELLSLPVSQINQNIWNELDDCKFILNIGLLKLLSKLRNRKFKKLGDVFSMKRGVLFDKNLLTNQKTGVSSYPYFEGNVYRYILNYYSPKWVEYGSKMREYPKDFVWFEKDRILLRRLVNRRQRLMATHTKKTVITNKNLYTIKPTGKESISFILGILNSSLLSKLYLAQVSQATKDDFPQVTIRDTLFLPCPVIDFSNSKDKSRHEKMVKLVDRMLELNKKASKIKSSHDNTVLQRKIEATDKQIDQLVYELYGLTDKEIKIVEKG